jgi:hypothetical protein
MSQSVLDRKQLFFEVDARAISRYLLPPISKISVPLAGA